MDRTAVAKELVALAKTLTAKESFMGPVYSAETNVGTAMGVVEQNFENFRKEVEKVELSGDADIRKINRNGDELLKSLRGLITVVKQAHRVVEAAQFDATGLM